MSRTSPYLSTVRLKKLLAFFLTTGLLLTATTLLSAQSETVLHSFTLQNGDGATPDSGVVADGGGSLYGVTYSGGALGPNSKGIAYKLTPSSGGAWHETVLYSFTGGVSDGGIPGGNLLIDTAARTIYGTAEIGGTHDGGVVFALSPGNPWTESVIYSFVGPEGSSPNTGVVPHNGLLYGTANGGTNGFGTVYRLHPPAAPGGVWHEQTVYAFTYGGDGGYPFAPPIFDAAGNLYGAAYNSATGAGNIYRLSPPTSSGPWTFTTLYSFTGGPDGGSPTGIVLNSAGALYGTAASGGGDNLGVVFKLTPPSGGTGPWTESVLHSFTGGTDGAIPRGAVIFDNAGNLYGTAGGGGNLGCANGGGGGCGVLFELTPGSGGVWTESVLYDFEGGNDGLGPQAAPLLVNSNFYGTTMYGGGTPGYGTVYEVTP
jgi:hypothetical protein